MGLKLSNNAVSVLATGISAASTSLTLDTGQGSRFPSLSSGEWFPLTIFDAINTEIVKVTARSGDVLTVERAQEGTAASDFLIGAHVELRITASAYSEMILPPGTGPLPWSLPTEPTGWIFCDGRTLLSNTPYGALRTAYINASFPYGQDGTGNPKIPDMRGRVPAGKDNMGGSAANRLTTAGSGVDGSVLGATGGAENHTLTTAQMPAHNHGVTDPGHIHGITDPTHAHSVYDPGHGHTNPSGEIDTAHGAVTAGTGLGYTNRLYASLISSTTSANATGIGIYGAGTGISVNGALTSISTQNSGSGNAHNNTQPTLVCCYIVKT